MVRRWKGSQAGCLAVCLIGLVLIAPPLTAQAQRFNPGVAPPHVKIHGKTYGQWSAEWWKWVIGIPAEINPLLDETGEFAAVGQSGPVWFLAGNFGGTSVRSVTIPEGKSILIPIFNGVFWAPDDLPFAGFLAELYGLDPSLMSDEELIRFAAIASVDSVTSMSATLDGRPLKDLDGYFFDSPAFQIVNTALLDDFGIPISQPNLSVSAGYWLMFRPMSEGEHTVQTTVVSSHPVLGGFSNDVTVHITIVDD